MPALPARRLHLRIEQGNQVAFETSHAVAAAILSGPSPAQARRWRSDCLAKGNQAPISPYISPYLPISASPRATRRAATTAARRTQLRTYLRTVSCSAVSATRTATTPTKHPPMLLRHPRPCTSFCPGRMRS